MPHRRSVSPSADLLYDAGNAKAGSEVWKKLAAEVMANVLGQQVKVCPATGCGVANGKVKVSTACSPLRARP
jgi:ABC-type uncharacterized transport system substrate-binding protein